MRWTPSRVSSAFQRFKPEAVIHQLTALRGMMDLRHFETVFAQTNLLRTKGTDILLAAARDVGARRFVAQAIVDGRTRGSADQSRPSTTPSILIRLQLYDRRSRRCNIWKLLSKKRAMSAGSASDTAACMGRSSPSPAE